ncbi:unnamed protein product [Peronospora belbahrii]|uniref:Uncharacterized protein n=1 Tax=Peronospora belbahrii TaxID=622444 RepID=A0ABN8CPA9_9STRA|nr:unnamed protein product [Peronospora belbahrii]
MDQDDTMALYERILSLIKPAELHYSSNDVLQDDFNSLKNSVDCVLASFVKVAEVRDAVNQLEQGKASSYRSASLMDQMDCTMQLQKTLGDRLEKIATGMEVVDVKYAREQDERHDKRKRKEKKHVYKEEEKGEEGLSLLLHEESTSYVSNEAEEEEEDSRCKKQKREVFEENETRVEKNGLKTKKQRNDLLIAHEALTEIMKVKTVNKRMPFESRKSWVIALFNIKRVLKHQSSRSDETTDNVAADVAARALEAAADVFTNLEWTGEHIEDVRSVIAALTDACSKNETLRAAFHRARTQLESLEMSIPVALEQLSVNTKPASARKSVEHQLQTYHDLAGDMDAHPPGAKTDQIIKALTAMQQVVAGDVFGVHQIDVRYSTSDVSRWIGETETPVQNNLLKEYTRYANGIIAYSKNFPSKPKQMEWQRLGTSILTLLDEKINSSQPARAIHSHMRFSSTTKKKQEQLVLAMDQLERMQDGIFSLDQVDKVVKTFSTVVSYQSKDWNPYSDHTVRKGLKMLTACIQMITKKTHRDKRLKTVNKWISALKKFG